MEWAVVSKPAGERMHVWDRQHKAGQGPLLSLLLRLVPSLTCCKEEAKVGLEVAIIHGLPCSRDRQLTVHLPA